MSLFHLCTYLWIYLQLQNSFNHIWSLDKVQIWKTCTIQPPHHKPSCIYLMDERVLSHRTVCSPVECEVIGTPTCQTLSQIITPGPRSFLLRTYNTALPTAWPHAQPRCLPHPSSREKASLQVSNFCLFRSPH